MSLKQVYQSEIRKAKRLTSYAHSHRTRRPQPPHYVNGFVQDRREREKILQRMNPE